MATAGCPNAMAPRKRPASSRSMADIVLQRPHEPGPTPNYLRDKELGRSSRAPFGRMRCERMVNPVILQRAEHTISRALIDPDALKVLTRLRQFNHVAYLVGGSVRDLLLGRRPK